MKIVSELKTKQDFIDYLRKHGVTKLPQGWSISDAVDAIESMKSKQSTFDELMRIQSKKETKQ